MLQHIEQPEVVEITADTHPDIWEILSGAYGVEPINEVIENTTGTIQTAQRRGAE